jgi:tRNA (guanine37-N1)-methyltransferase
MRFDVFTLFPQVFSPYLNTSMLKIAQEKKLLEVHLHDIRQWSADKHHTTDDLPYGGGGGMVMKPEPVFAAVESMLGKPPTCPVILLTPQGEPFTQQVAERLSSEPHLGLICGRYEGVDERIRQHLVTQEISIGDYVLSGGELPALVLIDSISRLLPGVLGDPEGAEDDSFSHHLLEYPHYTRPELFRDWPVPEELLSGDHPVIQRWRRRQSLLRTLQKRPDLLAHAQLDDQDLLDLREIEITEGFSLPEVIKNKIQRGAS